MRSSTSGSRYGILFAAVFAFLAGPVYLACLVYAPPARDFFPMATLRTKEFYSRIGPESVLLVRHECLASNIIDMDLLNVPGAVLSPESRPETVVQFLNETQTPPRQIVVLEDISLLLFGRFQAREASHGAPVPAKRAEDEEAPKGTLDAYLLALPYEQADRHRAFRGSVRSRESLLGDPALLREYLRQYVDRWFARIVPRRQLPEANLVAFWKRQAAYLATGDARHLITAFGPYGSQFLWPAVQRWLVVRCFEYEDLENAAPPPEYTAAFLQLASDHPATAAEEERYPMIQALDRADRLGAVVQLVILPSNPEYERFLRPRYEPYYRAMEAVCRRHGWRFRDLRTIRTPELQEHSAFGDHAHLITRWHLPFLETVARLLREEIRAAQREARAEPERIEE